MFFMAFQHVQTKKMQKMMVDDGGTQKSLGKHFSHQ